MVTCPSVKLYPVWNNLEEISGTRSAPQVSYSKFQFPKTSSSTCAAILTVSSRRKLKEEELKEPRLATKEEFASYVNQTGSKSSLIANTSKFPVQSSRKSPFISGNTHNYLQKYIYRTPLREIDSPLEYQIFPLKLKRNSAESQVKPMDNINASKRNYYEIKPISSLEPGRLSDTSLHLEPKRRELFCSNGGTTPTREQIESEDYGVNKPLDYLASLRGINYYGFRPFIQHKTPEKNHYNRNIIVAPSGVKANVPAVKKYKTKQKKKAKQIEAVPQFIEFQQKTSVTNLHRTPKSDKLRIDQSSRKEDEELIIEEEPKEEFIMKPRSRKHANIWNNRFFHVKHLKSQDQQTPPIILTEDLLRILDNETRLSSTSYPGQRRSINTDLIPILRSHLQRDICEKKSSSQLLPSRSSNISVERINTSKRKRISHESLIKEGRKQSNKTKKSKMRISDPLIISIPLYPTHVRSRSRPDSEHAFGSTPDITNTSRPYHKVLGVTPSPSASLKKKPSAKSVVSNLTRKYSCRIRSQHSGRKTNRRPTSRDSSGISIAAQQKLSPQESFTSRSTENIFGSSTAVNKTNRENDKSKKPLNYTTNLDGETLSLKSGILKRGAGGSTGPSEEKLVRDINLNVGSYKDNHSKSNLENSFGSEAALNEKSDADVWIPCKCLKNVPLPKDKQKDKPCKCGNKTSKAPSNKVTNQLSNGMPCECPLGGSSKNVLDSKPKSQLHDKGPCECAPNKGPCECAPNKGSCECAPNKGPCECAPNKGPCECAPNKGPCECAPNKGPCECAPNKGPCECAPNKGPCECSADNKSGTTYKSNISGAKHKLASSRGNIESTFGSDSALKDRSKREACSKSIKSGNISCKAPSSRDTNRLNNQSPCGCHTTVKSKTTLAFKPISKLQDKGPCECAPNKGPCECVPNKGPCECVPNKGPCECGPNKGPCECIPNKGPCECVPNKGPCECGPNKGPCECIPNKGPCECVPNKGPCECAPNKGTCECSADNKSRSTYKSNASEANQKLASSRSNIESTFGSDAALKDRSKREACSKSIKSGNISCKAPSSRGTSRLNNQSSCGCHTSVKSKNTLESKPLSHDRGPCECAPNKGTCECAPNNRPCECAPNKAPCECAPNKAPCECAPNKGPCECSPNKRPCECAPNKGPCECAPNKATCECSADNKSGTTYKSNLSEAKHKLASSRSNIESTFGSEAALKDGNKRETCSKSIKSGNISSKAPSSRGTKRLSNESSYECITSVISKTTCGSKPISQLHSKRPYEYAPNRGECSKSIKSGNLSSRAPSSRGTKRVSKGPSCECITSVISKNTCGSKPIGQLQDKGPCECALNKGICECSADNKSRTTFKSNGPDAKHKLSSSRSNIESTFGSDAALKDKKDCECSKSIKSVNISSKVSSGRGIKQRSNRLPSQCSSSVSTPAMSQLRKKEPCECLPSRSASESKLRSRSNTESTFGSDTALRNTYVDPCNCRTISPKVKYRRKSFFYRISNICNSIRRNSRRYRDSQCKRNSCTNTRNNNERTFGSDGKLVDSCTSIKGKKGNSSMPRRRTREPTENSRNYKGRKSNEEKASRPPRGNLGNTFGYHVAVKSTSGRSIREPHEYSTSIKSSSTKVSTSKSKYDDHIPHQNNFSRKGFMSKISASASSRIQQQPSEDFTYKRSKPATRSNFHKGSSLKSAFGSDASFKISRQISQRSILKVRSKYDSHNSSKQKNSRSEKNSPPPSRPKYTSGDFRSYNTRKLEEPRRSNIENTFGSDTAVKVSSPINIRGICECSVSHKGRKTSRHKGPSELNNPIPCDCSVSIKSGKTEVFKGSTSRIKNRKSNQGPCDCSKNSKKIESFPTKASARKSNYKSNDVQERSDSSPSRESPKEINNKNKNSFLLKHKSGRQDKRKSSITLTRYNLENTFGSKVDVQKTSSSKKKPKSTAASLSPNRGSVREISQQPSKSSVRSKSKKRHRKSETPSPRRSNRSFQDDQKRPSISSGKSRTKPRRLKAKTSEPPGRSHGSPKTPSPIRTPESNASLHSSKSKTSSKNRTKPVRSSGSKASKYSSKTKSAHSKPSNTKSRNKSNTRGSLQAHTSPADLDSGSTLIVAQNLEDPKNKSHYKAFPPTQVSPVYNVADTCGCTPAKPCPSVSKGPKETQTVHTDKGDVALEKCYPNTCGKGCPVTPCEVSYAHTVVSKFENYTIYEVTKQFHKKPRNMSRVTEGVFVVKCKK